MEAADLPRVVGRGECPVGGRVIQDGAVGSVLPSPGTGVYAEALTPAGPEELEIRHLRDGTIELEGVGDDSGSAGTFATAGFVAAGSPSECSDSAYKNLDFRVTSVLHYRLNVATTPSELSRADAVDAVRRGGAGVFNTRNNCGLGDRVPEARLVYDGKTTAVAGVGDGACSESDGQSVVSFGNLPKALAVTCIRFVIKDSGYGEVKTSDIKINKTDFNYTVRPGLRSCKNRWDLQGLVTHERGHTFGLGHAEPEKEHHLLTMSPGINGPCQPSERTLGKGDVLGLDRKYR